MPYGQLFPLEAAGLGLAEVWGRVSNVTGWLRSPVIMTGRSLHLWNVQEQYLLEQHVPQWVWWCFSNSFAPCRFLTEHEVTIDDLFQSLHSFHEFLVEWALSPQDSVWTQHLGDALSWSGCFYGQRAFQNYQQFLFHVLIYRLELLFLNLLWKFVTHPLEL